MPVTPPPQPNQGFPALPPQHQLVMPLALDIKDLDEPNDIPDLIDVPKEIVLGFEALANDVLNYQF